MTAQPTVGRRALGVLLAGGLFGFIAGLGLLIPNQMDAGTLGASPLGLVLAAFLLGVVAALVDQSKGVAPQPFWRRMLGSLWFCLLISLYRIRLETWPVSVAVQITISMVIAGILALVLEPLRRLMDTASPESQDPS